MARIRTIKPEFFTSLTVAGLPVEARLTFIGLWTHVDDEGRCVDDARLVKAALWPLDDRVSGDVETDLRILSESSLILRYKVGARSFIAVRGWAEHQRINRPTKSKLPPPPPEPPPGTTRESPPPPPAETPPPPTPTPPTRLSSSSPHAQLTEESRQERNREQGTGNRENPSALALVASPLALVVRADDPPTTTQALIGEWIEHCRKRPPGNVIGQVSRQVKAMLAEGMDPSDVRRGFAEWARKGLHPSTLPSVVNEVMNSGTGQPVQKPSTADQRFGDAMALARKFAEEEAS